MSDQNFDTMSLEDIIEFCKNIEIQTVEFYEELAANATNASGKTRFLALAEMERGHVNKLDDMDAEAFFQSSPAKVVDLKVTEYMVEMVPGKHLNTQEALILAAQREKAARDLYLKLTEYYKEEPLLTNFFTMMAEEEATHKRDLEDEYERNVQGEF